MRRPVVDYRDLRLLKLGQPQYNHLLYLVGWVVYFILYFLTETFISYDKCYSVHCFVDDVIPFCEYFVIPYVGWYLLIILSLLYFALYNPNNFKNMSKYIIIVQILATIIYIVFPNRQDLRPEVFARDNILTDIVAVLYRIDTCTGVCPSLHVSISIGIASTWLREQSASRILKASVATFCALVCMSVAFVKQHSVVDIFVAIPICFIAEYITFIRSKRKKLPFK